MPSLKVSLTKIVNKFVGYIEANITLQHLPEEIARSIKVSEVEGDEETGDLTQHVYIGGKDAPQAKVMEYGGSGQPYDIHPVRADHLKFFWKDHYDPSDPDMGSEGKLYKKFDGNGYLMNFVTHPGHAPGSEHRYIQPAIESVKSDILKEFGHDFVLTIKSRFFGRNETIK